jgi:hypothetical protein
LGEPLDEGSVAVRAKPNIDRELLAKPVKGVKLRPGTLGDQLGKEPTLLVFLRHFG